MKYAILETNHIPNLSFARPEQNKNQENYYTSFAGDVIALSMCNKPLNL